MKITIVRWDQNDVAAAACRKQPLTKSNEPASTESSIGLRNLSALLKVIEGGVLAQLKEVKGQ